MGHTPGPWKIERRATRGEFVTTTHIVAKNGDHIAVVSPCNIEANANLIAAAAELFEAAKNLYTNACDLGENIGEDGFECSDYDALYRAITKAKGEALECT